MSGTNLNYRYAPFPPTVSDRFRSIFQDVLSSPICTRRLFFFYTADMRSSGGHDFVMLSLWENIQITSIPKILEISDSFHHFCSSIPQYVTTRDCFCLAGVLIKAWRQMTSTEVK